MTTPLTTLTFGPNAHNLLTSAIWEVLSVHQVGQTDHIFQCRMWCYNSALTGGCGVSRVAGMLL